MPPLSRSIADAARRLCTNLAKQANGLAQAGLEVTASDISPGTVDLLAAVAPRLGVPLATRVDDAARVLREHLDEAIAAGGSSLRDHRQISGELGYFQHSFQVYDREGEPCRTKGCHGTVQRFVQNGRSTFWCPKCQK